MRQYEKAIIKTLSYSAVFQYPLDASQIWRFLIWEDKKQPKITTFLQILNKLVKEKKIIFRKNYYLLSAHYIWLMKREKEERRGKKRKKTAQKVARLLSFFPSILLIGLSGKLALGVSAKDDDIDLLVICKRASVWQTRFLTLLLLAFLGIKRKPLEKKADGKICVNMFLDENHLKLPQKEQDLYSAHEVTQLKILFEKNNCYQRFLKSNLWVRRYLPNTIGRVKVDIEPTGKSLGRFNLFEQVTRVVQLWYMRNKRTNEVVKAGYLRFHPQDMRGKVLKEYNKLISRYNL